MDIEYARSRLYELTESFGLVVGQYTLVATALLLGAIESVSGVLSAWCRDKAERFKEKRIDKGEGPLGRSPSRPDPRIHEGSSEGEVVVADEGAVPSGSGETVEDLSEEPSNSLSDEEEPSVDDLYDGNSQDKPPVPN